MWMFESSLLIEILLSLHPYQWFLFTFWVNCILHTIRHTTIFQIYLFIVNGSALSRIAMAVKFLESELFLQKYLFNNYYATSIALGIESTESKQLSFLILLFHPAHSISPLIFMPAVNTASNKYEGSYWMVSWDHLQCQG